MSYTKGDAYQKEIAEQYKRRNLQLSPSEVHTILSQLDFNVDVQDVREAEAGNMNATFLTSQYAVKISADRNMVKYAANKIVSDALPEAKVVRVLHHDIYNATDYEVLVMERSPGVMWLADMPTMSEEENRTLFTQVLDVASACRDIAFTKKFGWVTDIYADEEKNSFETFREQLEARLRAYLPKIRSQTELDIEAVERLATYVKEHLSVFDTDTASFVHRDLHMGNVLHENAELTAVIDFDSAVSAPSYMALVRLVGLIDDPTQFVKGTDSYSAYEGLKFEYLYPELKSAFARELEDRDLVLKLNLLGIIEGLMWISQNWSLEWSKEMIENLSSNEMPLDNDLSSTYFGEIIEKIKNS